MIQTTPDRLAALAKELVAAAGEKNLTVRVLGGVAVYMTCPGIQTHPTLQRAIKDIDLAAAQQDFGALAPVFTARGAATGASDSQRLLFYKDGAEIEVTVPDFRESHRVDLAPRLSLTSPTLPLADLLLIKLQRKKFDQKDIQDAIALLLDHDVATGEQAEQINAAYIAGLTAHDWGLFRTVYDNTVSLEKVLDRYLEAQEAQLVWRRIELVQGAMDQEPKSLGWMLNQVVRKPHQVPA